MTIGQFVIEFPPKLFDLLKYLCEIVAKPMPEKMAQIVNLPLNLFLQLIQLIIRLTGVDLTIMDDVINYVTNEIAGYPFGVYLVMWSLTVGVVFTIVFAIFDVIDRINFIT